MTTDELIRPFAVGIAAKAELLGLEPALSAAQQARVRESIGQDIRKLCDVIYPAVRLPEVSTAAHTLATAMHIDLRRESWQSQTRFDPGRRLFLLEHWTPVGMLRDSCLSFHVEEMTPYLDHSLRIVWITRDEDRELTRLKYRSRRPDPAKAYTEAGITLL